MTTTAIRPLVIAALEARKDADEFAPGGNLHQLNDAQIADDLAAFDDALGDFAPAHIEPHVVEWMSQQNWLHRAA